MVQPRRNECDLKTKPSLGILRVSPKLASNPEKSNSGCAGEIVVEAPLPLVFFHKTRSEDK